MTDAERIAILWEMWRAAEWGSDQSLALSWALCELDPDIPDLKDYADG